MKQPANWSSESAFSETIPNLELLLGERIPPGVGITGWSVRHRKTACVNDVHQVLVIMAAYCQVHSSVRSILCAPLVYRGEVKARLLPSINTWAISIPKTLA